MNSRSIRYGNLKKEKKKFPDQERDDSPYDAKIRMEDIQNRKKKNETKELQAGIPSNTQSPITLTPLAQPQ